MADVNHAQRQQPQPGNGSQDTALNHMEAPSEEPGSAGLGSRLPSLESNSSTDTETDALLHRLSTELEEERDKSLRICAELAEERENRQLVLSLLEEEKKRREEERKEREAQLQDLQTQLSQAQTQCLEIQRYKEEEKEVLTREVHELRRRLQEEEEVAERRLREEVANYTQRLQSLEEERGRQEEEMRRLKEEHRGEVQTVRQLLEEREREEEEGEREEMGLKASKNKRNQARASLGDEEGTSMDEAGLEAGPGENGLNGPVSGDVDPLMERYLSSVHPTHNESFEEHSLLENSANYRSEESTDCLCIVV